MEHCELRIQVSQGNAATDLRWGGRFDPNFLRNRSENLTMKELLNWSKFANVVAEINVAPFLRHSVFYFVKCVNNMMM